MPKPPTPRFKPGDYVIYMGSLWGRRGGMYVSSVIVHRSSVRYDLRDPIWGGGLRSVRESSLRSGDLPSE